MSPPRKKRVSRLRLYLPTTLLVFVALGWSGFWLVAADRAGAVLERWMAREAAAGRNHGCDERSIGGYPFRIELRCEAPRVEALVDGEPLVLSAARFVAVAQLPRPSFLIGELTGPLEIERAPAGISGALAFRLARASLSGAPGRPERASVRLEGPDLTLRDRTGATLTARADALELHGRTPPGAEPGTLDVAGRLAKLEFPPLRPLLGQAPGNLDFDATITGADALAPRPTPDRLRAFAARGGKLRIASFRVDAGEVAAEAKGELALDAAGRPTGALDVTVAGLGKLLAQAGGNTLMTVGVTALGKPARLGDKPASSYTVRLEGGRVSVGPLALGSLAPLF